MHKTIDWVWINNRNNFLIGPVPSINPLSRNYSVWWKEMKRRSIEGFWSIDDSEIKVNAVEANPEFPEHSDNWRYIPGNTFFYVNFGTILMSIKGAARSAPKKLETPRLDDLEWELGYKWMEARGFSGFEFDETYSCNRMLLDKEITDDEIIEMCLDQNNEINPLLFDNFFKEDKSRKEYTPVRQYIKKLFSKDMGKPIYGNTTKNLMLISSRDGGKSEGTAGQIITPELLFDGARYYNEESRKNPALTKIVVGAAISTKSTELLRKVKRNVDHLKGVWKKNTSSEVDSPFYKHMEGSLSPGETWKHFYEKKVGNDWKPFGTGSHISHFVFTVNNPEAAAGERSNTIVIEEAGLVPNLLTILGSNDAVQNDGGIKFGSTMCLGCVCAGTKVRANNGRVLNIEDLQIKDGVFGYDGLKSIPQKINYINPPAKKHCYKITTEGNRSLECSWDHSIFMSKSKWDTQINWKSYRNCTFKKANELKIGDRIGIAKSINIFGDYKNKDARLLGLLIGDGSYGFGGGVELSAPDIDIYNFVTEKYECRENKSKEFTMANGEQYKHLQINGVIPMMRDCGLLGQTGMNKRLPENIHSYTENSLCELIGGYWDADGNILLRKNGQVKITITSIVLELLEELRFQLKRLGIDSSIHKEKKAGTTTIKGKDCQRKDGYVLHITDQDSKNIFKEKITFLIKSKQTTLNAGRSFVKKNYRSAKPLRYVECDIEGREFFNGMTDLKNVDFSRVKKIEYIGEKDIYNLNASNTHTYLANDFITGNTGGSIEKVVETEIVFKDPEGYDFLEFENEWEPEDVSKIGWFIPAPYMSRGMKDSNGNTKVQEGYALFEKRRKNKSKAASSKASDLELMNYPFMPSEMFLSADGNIFPVKDIKHQYSKLLSNKKALALSYKVEFIIKEDNSIDFKNVKSNPIREFPIKSSSEVIMDGCPEIFIMPYRDGTGKIPSNVYIAGYDPIDDDDNSDITRSLQSFIIMNRLTGEICLEYTGRTSLAIEFYEQCRRALMFFNARCNYENNKKGFYAHMHNKSCTYLLTETPEILMQKDMQKSRGIGNKSLGTNVGNKDIKAYGLELILNWITDEVGGQNGDVIPVLSTIKSPALLRELMLFNPDGNFDRISALIVLLILREDKRRIVKKSKDKIKSALDDDFFKDTWDDNRNNNLLY